MQNVGNVFDLKEKIIDFLEIILFYYLKLNTKQNMEKILTNKQMLQRLPIAFAQIKAGNTSENLLNEIKQIIYSLYWAKEITKKVYNNIVNSRNLVLYL